MSLGVQDTVNRNASLSDGYDVQRICDARARYVGKGVRMNPDPLAPRLVVESGAVQNGTAIGQAECVKLCSKAARGNLHSVSARKSPNDPKLSDGGAWRGSCEGGAKDSIQATEKGGSK